MTTGQVLAGGLIALLLVALTVGGVILYSLVLVWNLTDIQNVGFNFWNVFWIVLFTFGAVTLLRGKR